MIPEQRDESRLRLIVFLQVEQGPQFVKHKFTIHVRSLTNDNPLDIQPVLHTPSEGFEDEQVLRGARGHGDTGFDLKGTGSLDHSGFVRQRAERNVERNPIGCFYEQDTPFEGKATGLWNPRRILEQDGVDKRRLTSDTGEQREIDIACLPRFAPPLHGEAADDATSPTAGGAERLDAGGRRKESIHDDPGA